MENNFKYTVLSSGTAPCIGNSIYYTGSDTCTYITSNSSVGITDDLIYYIPERFSYDKKVIDKITLFPFEIVFKIIHASGNLGTKYDQFEYDINLNGKLFRVFHPGKILSKEELEDKLKEDSKKWLDDQMKSTWKMD